MVGAPRAGVLGIVYRIVETFGRIAAIRQHAVRQCSKHFPLRFCKVSELAMR
jgi:hypothetical protein